MDLVLECGLEHNSKQTFPRLAFELPDDYEYAVWCSFVEVYNENVHDLFSIDSKPKNLSLKQDHKHSDNKFVAGATTVRLWSETVRPLRLAAFRLQRIVPRLTVNLACVGSTGKRPFGQTPFCNKAK